MRRGERDAHPERMAAIEGRFDHISDRKLRARAELWREMGMTGLSETDL